MGGSSTAAAAKGGGGGSAGAEQALPTPLLAAEKAAAGRGGAACDCPCEGDEAGSSSSSSSWLFGVRWHVPKLGMQEDAPEYQRRPFILSGYRLDTEGCVPCLQSAVYMHNETVNIWSHLLPFVIVAAWVWRVCWPEATTSEVMLVVALALVTMNCLFCSAFYHTRHCDIERICFNCFYADMAGVVVLLGSSLAVGITLGFSCMPVARNVYLLGVLLMIFVMAAVASWPDATDELRAKAFGSCGIAGLVPAVHFVAAGPAPLREILLLRIAGVLLFYCSGVAVYVLRFPEQRWPGRFDYCGQSHNLWHLCVVLGMFTWLDGCYRMAMALPTITC